LEKDLNSFAENFFPLSITKRNPNATSFFYLDIIVVNVVFTVVLQKKHERKTFWIVEEIEKVELK
jgi:hypothetical protein